VTATTFSIAAACVIATAILAYLGGYRDGWKARDEDE